MKNLVMSALVLGALSQAAGCIFVSDDTAGDDVPVDGEATIDVTWNLVDTFLDDGSTPGCDGAGAGTINISLAGTDAEPEFTDTFDCAAGGGVATQIPLGQYDVWVDITLDGAGTTLYAQSEIGTVNLDVDGETAEAIFDIEVVNGFFDVAWTFANGESCADAVSEDGVSIVATLAGTAEGIDDVFDCEDGGGVTPALPIGDYVVVAYVIDDPDGSGPDPGLSLGDSGEIQTSIDYGNEFVLLDPVITID